MHTKRHTKDHLILPKLLSALSHEQSDELPQRRGADESEVDLQHEIEQNTDNRILLLHPYMQPFVLCEA